MLRELARASPLARTDRFDTDHRRVLVALESLRRHGYQGAASGTRIPSLMRAASEGPVAPICGDRDHADPRGVDRAAAPRHAVPHAVVGGSG